MSPPPEGGSHKSRLTFLPSRTQVRKRAQPRIVEPTSSYSWMSASACSHNRAAAAFRRNAVHQLEAAIIRLAYWAFGWTWPKRALYDGPLSREARTSAGWTVRLFRETSSMFFGRHHQ